jgi:hypothetical protein
MYPTDDHDGVFDLPEKAPSNQPEPPASASDPIAEAKKAYHVAGTSPLLSLDLDDELPEEMRSKNRPKVTREPAPHYDPVAPADVGLREFPADKFPINHASRDALLDFARVSLFDADQGYFLAGDAINHLLRLPPPHVNAPRYTTRSIADLLGSWKFSFVSKLSVVSAELDSGARAFALKHRVGWQACYEACVQLRKDCSDEPITAYLARYLASRNSKQPARPEPSLHATELVFANLCRSSIKADQRVGRYGRILYGAAKRLVEFRLETPMKVAEWQSDLDFRIQQRSKHDAEIKNNAIAVAARLCLGNEALAEADFKTLLEYIQTANPDDEFDHGTFEAWRTIYYGRKSRR